MRRFPALFVAAGLLAASASSAAADHELPFDIPLGDPLLAEGALSGGGEWEFIGNGFEPAGTDTEVFTQGAATYASRGVLAFGTIGGGQSIYQIADNGEPMAPELISRIGTASCFGNPGGATGLQHDVEAVPQDEAQLLLDATDAPGRCHDQGLGLPQAGAPRGGLEIIDISDVTNPQILALTVHVGQAHTVKTDPALPGFAWVSTSDFVVHANRVTEDNLAGTENLDLDGFEFVDFRTCLNLPADMPIEDKRAACRPEVYRYRFEPYMTQGLIDSPHPDFPAEMSGGCHEMQTYHFTIDPDRFLVTCAGVGGSVLLDLTGSFAGNGDPQGDPLPCAVRESSTAIPLFATDAPVIDCHRGDSNGEADGGDEVLLENRGWIEAGSPSLGGVEVLGWVNHGSGAQYATHNAAENLAISHEAELTHSGDFMLVTDERGGGIIPPSASCDPFNENPVGNGGVHAFAVERLITAPPADADGNGQLTEELAPLAEDAYALNSDGERSIFRAPVRVPSPSFCTSHLMHQIPGQNRIFMGWYTQGVQVVDYTENDDGTIDFAQVAHWIPPGANTWGVVIFQVGENEDGSFTYTGVTGDIGRGTDVFRVTLPPPGQAPPLPQPSPSPSASPSATATASPTATVSPSATTAPPSPAPSPTPQLPTTGGGGGALTAAAAAGLLGSTLYALRRRRPRTLRT